MNLDYTYHLREPIQALLKEASRINSYKPIKYWYPLSIATYDVEEILAAVDSLCTFRTTMWEKTVEFERQFSKTFGVPEAIMVNSGTSADMLIAFALVNPQAKLLSQGDEILVPSVTWPTQIWTLKMAGFQIRFIDTDSATLNIDLDDLESKIGPKTRGISLVHLMGNPCDMDRVTKICETNSLILVEDCCESLGASYKGQQVGTFGIAAAFSFFFSHHITTMEGGMVTCKNKAYSDLFRLLRAHGWARNNRYLDIEPEEGIDPRYMFVNMGFNVRPTELQAGFGLEQLRRWPSFHMTRKRNAKYFAEYLERYKCIMRLMHVLPDAECSWFALPILLQPDCPFQKSEFLEYLEIQGVETRPIVAGNLARQPVCNLYPELMDSDLPGSDHVHNYGFYVGLHPFEARKNLDRLKEVFDGFLVKYS